MQREKVASSVTCMAWNIQTHIVETATSFMRHHPVSGVVKRRLKIERYINGSKK